jgi:hypothetical protein
VVEPDGRAGSHVITAVAGSGAAKQAYNFATDRVVGNGSFGVVFQATCLETAETVRRARRSGVQAPGRGAGAGRVAVGGLRRAREAAACAVAAPPSEQQGVPDALAPPAAAMALRWRSRRCCRTSASRTASSRS